MILLAVPTKFELEGIERYGFDDHGQDIKRVIGGFGLIQTVYTIQRNIRRLSPELIIHAGIAGSFRNHIHPGTCGEVVSEMLVDIGSENSKGEIMSANDLGLIDGNLFPFSMQTLHNETDRPQTELAKWSSITVPYASGSKETVNRRQELGRAIENMEGMALFYTCLMESQAFISLRAISNYVEERNEEAWNFDLAFRGLAQSLDDLLSRL